MKKTCKAILAAVLTLAVGVGVTWAQHDHSAMVQQTQGEPDSGSKGTMQACQKHGSENMAALDKLDKTIAAGRASNDPAHMKAALEQAQTEVAEVKHHMSMCPMMGGAGMQGHDMQHMDHMDHMKGMSNQ